MPSFHGITAWLPSTLAPPQSYVADLLPLMHATPSRRKGAAVTCRQRGSDCCSGRGASLLSPVQSTVPRLAPPPLSALLPWVASKRPSTGHFPGSLLADARHRSSPRRRLSNLSRPRRQNTTPPVPAGETQQAGREGGTGGGTDRKAQRKGGASWVTFPQGPEERVPHRRTRPSQNPGRGRPHGGPRCTPSLPPPRSPRRPALRPSARARAPHRCGCAPLSAQKSRCSAVAATCPGTASPRSQPSPPPVGSTPRPLVLLALLRPEPGLASPLPFPRARDSWAGERGSNGALSDAPARVLGAGTVAKDK